MKLQMALDLVDIDSAKLLDELHDIIDIVEIGTPLSVPVKDEQKVIGVLVIGVDLDVFEKE